MIVTQKDLTDGLIAGLTKDRAALLSAMKAIREIAKNQGPAKGLDQLYEIYQMACESNLRGASSFMKVLELLEAHCWQPGDEHPAVKVSVLEAGIQRGMHDDVCARLDEAQGNAGVVSGRDSQMRMTLSLVERGNWIVERGVGVWEVYTDREFKEAFQPAATWPS